MSRKLFDIFKYKQCHIESGGLLEESTPRGEQQFLNVPSQFIAPRRIDSRDMCLSSSNQHNEPSCAGYTTAGYIEYYNWKTYHYPAQINGDRIYDEAKIIDKNNHPGTTLKSAANAALNLNLITGTPKYVDFPNVNKSNLSRKEKRIISIKFALHKYGVVLSGFRITDDWDWVDKKTGIIRNTGDRSQSMGGHAVLLCGYCDTGVYIQNSWSENWGHHGFAILGWDQYDRQIMKAMVFENN